MGMDYFWYNFTNKYNYLNGCKVGRLDKSIRVLRRFTRDKKIERLVKLTKGKYTSRIQEKKKEMTRVYLLI